LLQVYQQAADSVAEGDHTTRPFVYELEFADVFKDRGGFDIVIANPPYVSVQGSSSLPYRGELNRRFVEAVNGREQGWVDDLYVHFAFRAFALARSEGVVCFITSDTYFTIQTKRRMRRLLLEKDLRIVAPCDPFNATVDAAVFLAFNRPRLSQPECEFNQMRYASDRLAEEPDWRDGARVKVKKQEYRVRQWLETAEEGEEAVRRYRLDPRLWQGTERSAFWEPIERNCALYQSLILPAEPPLQKWWPKISSSENYRRHREEIQEYLRSLKPGDLTLVGLVADGGVGLQTSNNGHFLAYLEGTQEAEQLIRKRQAHISRWEQHPIYGPAWHQCLKLANGNWSA
jgi:Eco57I restriction-modification methylase